MRYSRPGIVCWEPMVGYPDRDILDAMEKDLRNLHSDRARTTPRDNVDKIEDDWHRERPDVDVSSIGIVTRLWRVGRYFDRQRDGALLERGTDRASVDILAMLRRGGEPYRRSAGYLARHSLITAGGVSQRLEKLESAGLVERSVDAQDRRRVSVQLTPAGREVIDNVLGVAVERDRSTINEALSGKEQDLLRDLLRRLLLHFEPPVIDEDDDNDHL